MAALPRLIYCAGGNARFAQIAIEHGFEYGAQLPDTIYFPAYFVDQNWKNPDFEKYMKALAETRPCLATVLDWERWGQYARVIWWAVNAVKYATEAVVIIPKIPGSIRFIPKFIGEMPVRLGYSVPTRYGGTTVPISEFIGWPHGVHLLGGSPEKQIELSGLNKLAFFDNVPKLDVRSADTNYHQFMAKNYNQFWMPGNATWARNRYWPTLREANGGQLWGDGSKKADAPYKAFELSCQNIMKEWRSFTNVT